MEAPLENLVRLQWELIDRLRELKDARTVSGRLPDYPQEYYLLVYRTNAVMRQILAKRDSEEEAQIVPEVKREIERLEQTLEEVAYA